MSIFLCSLKDLATPSAVVLQVCFSNTGAPVCLTLHKISCGTYNTKSQVKFNCAGNSIVPNGLYNEISKSTSKQNTDSEQTEHKYEGVCNSRLKHIKIFGLRC